MNKSDKIFGPAQLIVLWEKEKTELGRCDLSHENTEERYSLIWGGFFKEEACKGGV